MSDDATWDPGINLEQLEAHVAELQREEANRRYWEFIKKLDKPSRRVVRETHRLMYLAGYYAGMESGPAKPGKADAE